MNGPLPVFERINKIRFGRNQTLWLGTDQGLFFSDDHGTSWAADKKYIAYHKPVAAHLPPRESIRE